MQNQGNSEPELKNDFSVANAVSGGSESNLTALPAEVGMILQLADGSIQACNPVAEKLLGLTAVQMQAYSSVSCSWQTVHEDGSPFPPQTHPAMVSLHTGQPCTNVVMGFCHPNGELIWLKLDSQPLFPVNQSVPYGVVTTFTRIAQPQVSELRSQHLLDTLESISDAFFSLDRGWRFTYLNSQATRLLNRSSQNLIGKSIWEEFPEAVESVFEQAYRRAVTERVTVSVEAFYEPLNAWYAVRAYPLESGLAVYFQDVTEQKYAQAAFIQQQQTAQRRKVEIEAIYATAPIGLCFVDTSLRFVRINERLAEINGVSAADHIGKTLREILPQQADDLEPLYQQVIQTGVPIENLEIQGTNAAQPTVERDWLISLYPLKTEGEQVVGVNATVFEITDRKQAEAALRKSEERYRTLFEAIDEAFCVIEVLFDENDKPLDYSFVEVNPAFEQHTGLKQATGKTARELIPNLEEHWFEIYGKIALTGEPYRFENGSAVMNRWFDVFAFRFGGEGSRKVGIRFKDISASKRAEIALKQQEEQLRLFVKHAPAGVAMFDTQMLYMLVSDRWLTSYGLDAQDIIGRSHYDVFPEVSQRWKDIHQRCLGGAVESCEEEPFPRADGTIDWVRWEIHPWRMSTNEIGGIIIFSEVISDRKRAEQRLRESEERLQLGVQVAGVALAKFDYASNTVELSPEARALYGLPGDELVVSRERIHATFHPEERAMLAQLIEQVLDPEGTGWFVGDHRVVLPNGKVRWLTIRKQVFFDYLSQPPRPNYAILAAIDISDRKQAEIQRESLLQKEQAARAEADKANRIKDEFLAVLSHELRTPLNPILGWSKLLLAGNLNPSKATEALQTIERNANLQAKLIEDLLDVSRILRGKLTLNIAPVNLATTIEAALETVQLAAKAKNIQIQTVFATDVKQVSGDGGRLQQVVWNLLSNAVKFTPEGGRIKVRLTQVNNYAQIQVSDTGKGISPDFLPYVFERFRQEDGATTRKFGGLGLGLAIVRQLVELHGGKIHAQSQGDGLGATFTVQLPCLHSATEEEVSKAPSPINVDKLPLSGLRILVVDDDADSRDFIAFVLQMEGADVQTAPSGMDALQQILTQTPFDFLVSDIGMPEMDGYMLIEQIRTQLPPQYRQIRALALTAYAGEANERQVLQAGFEKHLAKPVDPTDLVSTITHLLTAS